jgi:excisionase family DNA binding protein
MRPDIVAWAKIGSTIEIREMAQRVLIPLPGVGTLALDEDTYRRALEEGSKFNPPAEPTTDPDERLLDSKQLADILQVPVTWIEQQAREGNIPSLSFGRRRRYRRSAVEAAIKHLNINSIPR